MTPDPDDEDAFTWEGDEHPTRAPLHRPTAPEDAESSPVGSGLVADASESETPERPAPPSAGPDGPAEPATGPGASERQPMGNVALVATGILGGIYLLYAVGWIIGGLRVSSLAGYLVSTDGHAPATWSGGNVVGIWLAALAPLLWFATVWIVSRGSRPWVRWVWLLAGAVLLVPWPLLMGIQG